MTPIRDIIAPIVSRALDRKQMDLFGGTAKTETPVGWANGRTESGGTCDDAHETPAANHGGDPDQGQDRHRSSSVGQGPVQTSGLAQALGKSSPEPFDFAAHPDPRAVPRPGWVVPEELRLPTDETPP